MTRLLFDRLRVKYKGTELGPLFNQATVFYNGDAMEHILNESLDFEEMHSFAPPYEVFFVEMEYRVKGIYRNDGVLFIRREMPVAQEIMSGVQIVDDAADAKWLLEGFVFANNWHEYRVGRCVVVLNDACEPMPVFHKEGMAYSVSWITRDFYEFGEQVWQQTEGMVQPEFGRPITQEEHRIGFYDYVKAIIDAGMYTLGMLNCRNISTEDRDPIRAEAKKFQRKHGLPMSSYKVLKLAGKGQSAGMVIGDRNQDPTLRALHWCRGHTRTYTDDAPLFGKVTGTFYIGEHIRGKITEGTVIKDYEVVTHER